MATGTVKAYNNEKGYGSLTPDGQPGISLILHFSDVAAAGISRLKPGQRLEYSPEQGRNCVIATKLKPLAAT